MTTKCNNWNSNKPEKLFNAAGRAIGVLMPRIDAATLAASTGIRSYSKPGGAFNVRMFEPASVANFAAHWERHYQRTYPLAAKITDA